YEPLIEQYEIVRSPSASAIAQIRQDTASRTPATKTLAVFADPVFTPDDERVKTPVAATPPDELLLAAIPEPRG
ncbi:hypothetical protein, partial [Lyngbya sp. CCY1209]|uniref:hypothetical protein n=1 Tax=Lyngbya sp. CCY1209 TaxID=2886103 RepID=UPI002D203F68